MSAFADDVEAALADLELEAGEPVTYRRGAHSALVTAIPGSAENVVETEEHGLAIRIRTVEFRLRGAELVLGGVPALPQRGDVIERHTLAGSPQCRVASPGGQDHFHFCDPRQRWLRIHTTEVSRQPCPPG